MKLNINKNNLPYIINWIFYYAWVIVFTTWWTSSSVTDKLMGADSRVILHSLILISSAIYIIIMKREWFRTSAYVGGIMVLLFSILSMLKLNQYLHLISIILLSVSLGIVNISILIPMVYILNDFEKLISIVVSNLLIGGLVLFQELNILSINNGLSFSFIMLLVSVFPIVFFKTKDLKIPQENINSKKLNKIMILSITVNCIYSILCKGMGRAFVVMAINNLSINLYPAYYIGAIIGCLICFFIYLINKFGSYILLNMVFGIFAISMFIYATAQSQSLYYIFSFLMGVVSSMGMINMYYWLGVIGKKYSNYLFVKLFIILIGFFGGVSGVIFGSKFSNVSQLNLGITLSIISVIITVSILMISPFMYKTYRNDEYDIKERKSIIIKSNSKKYKLTKREQELCEKLLEGYTLRQTSAMMGISYFTANGYYKNIYKKLNINTRLELMRKFKENI